MNILTVSLLSIFLLLGVTACNTMEGAGKDIESAGDGLEHTANHNKKY